MDWTNVVKQLRARGMSQAEIGKRLGKSQAFVSALSKGLFSDVKWRDGQVLLALLYSK